MKGAAENIGSVNAELSRRSRELGIRTIGASNIACERTTPCANYKGDLLHLTPSGYEALTRIAREGMGSSWRFNEAPREPSVTLGRDLAFLAQHRDD